MVKQVVLSIIVIPFEKQSIVVFKIHQRPFIFWPFLKQMFQIACWGPRGNKQWKFGQEFIVLFYMSQIVMVSELFYLFEWESIHRLIRHTWSMVSRSRSGGRSNCRKLCYCYDGDCEQRAVILWRVSWELDLDTWEQQSLNQQQQQLLIVNTYYAVAE